MNSEELRDPGSLDENHSPFDDALSKTESLDRFAPEGIHDGRSHFNWETRWPAAARRKQRFEASYIAGMLLLTLVAIFGLWFRDETSAIISIANRENFVYHGLAFLGGLLGGLLLDLKWLYHGVAKGLWNADRVYWRIFSPFISGTVAFVVSALVASGVFLVLDRSVLLEPPLAIALGFLTGYFSDRAIGGMAELAKQVYGRRAEKSEAAQD